MVEDGAIAALIASLTTKALGWRRRNLHVVRFVGFEVLMALGVLELARLSHHFRLPRQIECHDCCLKQRDAISLDDFAFT